MEPWGNTAPALVFFVDQSYSANLSLNLCQALFILGLFKLHKYKWNKTCKLKPQELTSDLFVEQMGRGSQNECTVIPVAVFTSL